ncbi:hypothetical protein ACLOJK_028605 [Asimina triloba]
MMLLGEQHPTTFTDSVHGWNMTLNWKEKLIRITSANHGSKGQEAAFWCFTNFFKELLAIVRDEDQGSFPSWPPDSILFVNGCDISALVLIGPVGREKKRVGGAPSEEEQAKMKRRRQLDEEENKEEDM